MAKLSDFTNRLARNQHGGIMGYLRRDNGAFEGPMLLEIFVKDGRLTCADIERCRRQSDLAIDEEMGFRGKIIGLNGPLPRVLDCGDMLIALDD
ncbi:hypothetical protein [Pseudorhodoplanes sp.]|uniref:hypothetical protein n=1 Tax=Pseudorhodoplanes sp. TaxID=1934341 RepID=UPI002BD88152|nr:hypothetical protein [Pseudorhodoplanes sp.]HWV55498.1 hypothetical protein [Pseudorhodoplanes sp.]